MSLTEGIRESLDDDWMVGMGLDDSRGFYFAYFLMDLGPVQMASAQVFTNSGDQSSRGGVSLCTESAVRLVIGH